jgi:hypothetical protein
VAWEDEVPEGVRDGPDWLGHRHFFGKKWDPRPEARFRFH